MLRVVFRLFLVVYFLMPIMAIGLFIVTFVQMQNDVAPVYQSASTAITTATSALNAEVGDLRDSLAPLERTVNDLRAALQTIISFLRDTLYKVIDAVNELNPVCKFGGSACIPKALDVALPTLVDFSFVDRITTNINTITTQVNTVVTTMTTAITTYSAMFVLGAIILGGWLVLTYLLFFVMLYFGLWKRV